MNISSVVFVDASAWIALYHKRDNNHKKAWGTYEQLLYEEKIFLTTNWVAYEAISIIKSRVSYGAAKILWDILKNHELSEIVYINKQLEEQAIDIFWRYQDKKWGVMEMKRCLLAFGYDQHFVEASKQYGFTLL